MSMNEVKAAVNEMRDKYKDFYNISIKVIKSKVIKSIKNVILIGPSTSLFNMCIKDGVYPD